MSAKDSKPEFSEQELEDIRAAFQQFDLDKSGTIDATEVRELLKAIGEVNAPGYRVRELVEEVDTNKNGTIEFDEFLYVRNFSRDSGINIADVSLFFVV